MNDAPHDPTSVPDADPAGPSPVWTAALGVGLGAAAMVAWQQAGVPALAAVAVLGLGAGAALWQRQRTLAEQRRQARDAAAQQRLRLEREAQLLVEGERLARLGSFDWDVATHTLHWSEQMFRLLGYAPGEVLPGVDRVTEHIHPDDREHTRAELRRATAAREVFDCQHRMLRRDGSLIHVHARARLVVDTRGRLLRMRGAVRDVSDRVQAEATQRLHEFALDAITDTVSVVDSELRYRMANRAWRQVMRLDPADFTGQPLPELFPQIDASPRLQAIHDALTHDEVRVVRGPSTAMGQANLIFESRYFPFHDPAVGWRGLVLISRDVTEDEALHGTLRDTADNLRLTLNTVDLGIFASNARNPDEPVLFANEPLRRIWDIPADLEPLSPRVIIEHACRFFRDEAAEIARIEAIIASQLPGDDRLELKDGRVLMRRCLHTRRGGQAVRVWTFRDVTAEVQADRQREAAESRQRLLLDAFPGFIWGYDERLNLAYLNRNAAEVYQPRTDLIGLPAEQLLGRKAFERARPALECGLAGETQTVEWHRPSRSGRSPEHMLVKIVPVTEPDGRRLVYTFGIDISPLKTAQTALIAAKEEAERANRAKTQFLSSMSHELRTPLNAVIGFSQVLEQNAEGRLGERQLRQVGEIRRAGQHLLALINDLLDLARIEAGRTALDRVAVPLAEVVDECLQLMQPLAARRPCRLAPATVGPCMVLADRMRLKQVLLNLLSNAIKYNRAGGEVAVRCEPHDGQVLIEVQDEGPGLDDAAQARLFQPFERLAAEATDTEGTGIGLALSRQLVTLMGGQIGVRSEPGQGSCFWVRLPLAPRERSAESRRLLYVDDNPVNLALMEGLFEERPLWQLAIEDDPATALARIRAERPDVVLVDLQMPDIDGFELQRRLAVDPSTAAIPLVAVSADVTPATVERCRQLGFVDYVTKPVDADRMFAAVDKALHALTLIAPAT